MKHLFSHEVGGWKGQVWWCVYVVVVGGGGGGGGMEWVKGDDVLKKIYSASIGLNDNFFCLPQ